MPYTPTTWVSGTAPGISATNLNKIETGIDTAHDDLDTATSAATANKLARRDVNGDSSFRRITSTIVTGNAPLVVASTTKVINLNAELVDGFNPDTAAVALTIALRDAQGDLLARQFESTATTGTAPLVIASTTAVANLNVDRVDSIHFRVVSGILEFDDGGGFTPVGIVATKPRQAAIQQSAVQNTFYTVVDVVSGKGKLSYIAVALQTDFNENIEIRITVDGVAETFSVTSQNNARGLPHNGNASSQQEAGKTFDVFLATDFLSSMKVEVRHIAVTTQPLRAALNYSLV